MRRNRPVLSCCRGDVDDEQQRPHAPAGPPLVQYDLAELEEAGRLLSAEVEVVRAGMGHAGVLQEEYYKAWQDTADEFVLDEKVSWFVRGMRVAISTAHGDDGQ